MQQMMSSITSSPSGFIAGANDDIGTFIILSVAFLVFVYVVFRVIIRRDYTRHLKLSLTSYLMEILVFAVHANLFYATIPTKWPDVPSLPEDVGLQIISASLFSIGMIILLISWFGLGTKTSLGIAKDNLKTSGIYHYSRNPQLLGYGLMLFSWVVLFFSWSAMIWIVLYVVTAYWMIRSEEEFLKKKYKEAYTVYCEQVPRILTL